VQVRFPATKDVPVPMNGTCPAPGVKVPLTTVAPDALPGNDLPLLARLPLSTIRNRWLHSKSPPVVSYDDVLADFHVKSRKGKKGVALRKM